MKHCRLRRLSIRLYSGLAARLSQVQAAAVFFVDVQRPADYVERPAFHFVVYAPDIFADYPKDYQDDAVKKQADRDRRRPPGDGGIRENPLKNDDPDITLPAQARQIGGLGFYMAKKIMDSVEYEYKNGKNMLTIKKRLE
jgi:hypothetical protein